MSESEILAWLKIDDYRHVVEACETSPKSAKEISKIAGLSEKRCAEVIRYLETSRALEYTSGGWKATATAINTLKKYFR